MQRTSVEFWLSPVSYQPIKVHVCVSDKFIDDVYISEQDGILRVLKKEDYLKLISIES